MSAYTYGTTPEDVIRAALPQHFDMSLNREDMLAVLRALDIAEGQSEEPSEVERYSSLRSGVLSVIGIEEV